MKVIKVRKWLESDEVGRAIEIICPHCDTHNYKLYAGGGVNGEVVKGTLSCRKCLYYLYWWEEEYKGAKLFADGTKQRLFKEECNDSSSKSNS